MIRIRINFGVILVGLALVPLLLLPPRIYPGQETAWELPVKKNVLENGLPVILETDGSSETTAIIVFIRGGKRAEPAGKSGLAFLTTRLAVEIPDQDKLRKLLSLASRVSVTSREDYSLIDIECLSSNLEPTLKILSKIIADPLFSGRRIDAVKDNMRHQAKLELDDSVLSGHLASLAAFFTDPGYAGSIYGNDESISAIKGRDVSDFYKRRFTAANIVISASSDLKEDEIMGMIADCFAGLPAGEIAPLEPPGFRAEKEEAAFIPRETQQSYLSIAYSLPAMNRRQFVLSYLLENLLGKGPGSRLWPLRTEKRLAYNVNCRVTQMLEGGLVEAYLETDNSKRSTALEALRSTIGDLASNGIEAEEFGTVQTISKATFLRDNEARSSRTFTLGMFEALGFGYDYFSVLPAEIDAVSLEEMNVFIKSTLGSDKAFEVIVGGEDEKKSPSPILPGISWPVP
jgi:zinc protease